MTDMLTAALSYAEAGFQVLPCRPKSKVPMTTHGLKDATTDPEQIKRWWKSCPDANVAIRCGIVSTGLVVIDVDGPEGEASIRGKKLPPTVIAKTGGGGWHYLYFSEKRLRPKVGLLPKVDLRAEDSYIVAPPSIHPSGATYEWLLDHEPSNASRGKLPEWVYDYVDAPGTVTPLPVAGSPDPSKIGRAALQFVANGAPKGQQRLAAVAAARNLLTAGYSVDAVAHKLWQGFQGCEQDAEEPWTFEDAAKIASNVASSPAPPMREMKQPSQTPYSNGRKPVIVTTSATDLMQKQFPPVRFIIPGLWPEGMSLLAAKPKIGKTWLSLGIALSLAFGGVALGREKVDQGEVLYLALEDGERRIQGRLRAMLFDQSAPELLHFAYNWPRVNEGGIEALAEWMQVHPQTRLIVVDTLRKVRPQERVGASSYNQDYDAIAPLTDLAHEYNVSVWGVSHTRKMQSDDPLEMVSGTMGLTGAADHVIVLSRERGQAQGILKLMSRDIADQELALEWQPPHWILIGTAKEARQSAERKEICDALLKAGRPVSPKEMADILGKNHNTVKTLMIRMNMDGILMSDGRGKYEVFPTPYGVDEHGDPKREEIVNSVNSVNSVNRVNSVNYRTDVMQLTELTVDTKNIVIVPETPETTEHNFTSEGEPNNRIDGIGLTGLTGAIRDAAAQIIKDSKAVDGDVCFCGRSVYEYSAKGEPLCEQHTEEATKP